MKLQGIYNLVIDLFTSFDNNSQTIETYTMVETNDAGEGEEDEIKDGCVRNKITEKVMNESVTINWGTRKMLYEPI